MQLCFESTTHLYLCTLLLKKECTAKIINQQKLKHLEWSKIYVIIVAIMLQYCDLKFQ